MTYRIRIDEPLEKALRRIGDKQLRGAIHDLRALARQPDESVHAVRLRIKKLRALLKLFRSALEGRYQKMNSALRREARALSGLRDGQVLQTTQQQLRKAVGAVAWGELRKPAQSMLTEQRRQAAQGRKVLAERSDSAADRLERLRRRWARLSLTDGPQAKMFAGLERTYAKAKRTFAAADQTADPAGWHAFRKRAKDLRYQLQLVRDACPELIGPQAELFKQLSDKLGAYHDLAVFQAAIAPYLGASSKTAREAATGPIAALMSQRRDESRALAVMALAERPRAFQHRIRAYWTVCKQRQNARLHK